MRKSSLKKFLIITYAAIALIVAAVVSGVAIYYIRSSTDMAYSNYEDAMNQGYNTEIKSEVQSSIAVIEYYYNRFKAGELTEEQAKTEQRKQSVKCVTEMTTADICGLMQAITVLSCTRFCHRMKGRTVIPCRIRTVS